MRGFARLSPESRYRRFLAAMPELTEEMVRYLTVIDHHDHEAIVALDDKTGEGIGVARYVRSKERPDVAEVAVTVIDDWQGRGLGTLLLEAISARARAEGIRTFSALVLATNHEMIDLFKRLDHVRIIDRAPGTVEIEVDDPGRRRRAGAEEAASDRGPRPAPLTGQSRREIRRHLGEVDELSRELAEPVHVGEVGSQPEGRADGAAGRQSDLADVVVERHAIAELAADERLAGDRERHLSCAGVAEAPRPQRDVVPAWRHGRRSAHPRRGRRGAGS